MEHAKLLMSVILVYIEEISDFQFGRRDGLGHAVDANFLLCPFFNHSFPKSNKLEIECSIEIAFSKKKWFNAKNYNFIIFKPKDSRKTLILQMLAWKIIFDQTWNLAEIWIFKVYHPFLLKFFPLTFYFLELKSSFYIYNIGNDFHLKQLYFLNVFFMSLPIFES